MLNTVVLTAEFYFTGAFLRFLKISPTLGETRPLLKPFSDRQKCLHVLKSCPETTLDTFMVTNFVYLKVFSRQP